ncbi:hypothetical protein PR202_gb09590 [Eleusine coracana subsp. coracana]|uniref:Uncharacterized protein n=1 Tax=Eleusine coracana subsp. coracana TaxID=191504 RepID=A0AAV5EFZ6_ELECO|nr:hypothetical protein PR202_gb09590 [Eleusine coracana subsp. coracana]
MYVLYFYTVVYVRACRGKYIALLLLIRREHRSSQVNRRWKWRIRSAGVGLEADGAGVEAHLEGPLLHVPEDGHAAVLAAGGREREAPEGQDPIPAERHGRAASKRKRHRGQRHAAVSREVVARVEDPRGRRGRVLVRGHGGAERRPQRGVRGGREPRDHRAGVDDDAAREHGRRHVEFLPADADPRHHHDVVEGRVGQGEQLRGGDGGAAGAGPAAQREVPRSGGRGGEAVREGPAVGGHRLLHERDGMPAQAQEPVDPREQPGLRAAAAEEEARHLVLRRERERVGAVHARGVGRVSVPDHVPALPRARRAAAVTVEAEPGAGGAAARDRGVGGRLGRVVERVLLRVAGRRGAGRALHPGQVAARVHLHRLRHARGAQTHRDDVVERADAVAPARRHRRRRGRRFGISRLLLLLLLRRAGAAGHPVQYVLCSALVRAEDGGDGGGRQRRCLRRRARAVPMRQAKHGRRAIPHRRSS